MDGDAAWGRQGGADAVRVRRGRLRHVGPQPGPHLRDHREPPRGGRRRPGGRRGRRRRPRRRGPVRRRGHLVGRHRRGGGRRPGRATTPRWPWPPSTTASTSTSRSPWPSPWPMPRGSSPEPRNRAGRSWSATSCSTTLPSSPCVTWCVGGDLGAAALPLLEPAEPGSGAAGGELPLELRPPRHLDDPGPGGRGARGGVGARGHLPEPGRGRRDHHPPRLRRRPAGPRVRVVAAPVQGAAAGRGGRATPWRSSTTPWGGTPSCACSGTGSTSGDGPDRRSGRGRGRSRPADEPLRLECEHFLDSVAAGTTPAPTAPRACGSCGCWPGPRRRSCRRRRAVEPAPRPRSRPGVHTLERWWTTAWRSARGRGSGTSATC